MIGQELKCGEFVLIPVDFPELKTHNGVVKLRDRTLSPPAEDLIALLQELNAELPKRDQDLLEIMFRR